MFEARRKAFMERMGGKGIAIFLSCPEYQRSADSLEFTYRQDSNFYYLTGLDEPDSICVLAPEQPEHKFILFVRPRDPKQESWTGKRIGTEGAIKEYGADAAYSLKELDEKLQEYLKGCQTLYYSSGSSTHFDSELTRLLTTHRHVFQPRAIYDAMFPLSEMRVNKSPAELDVIRQAASISAEAYREVLKVLKPDMYEYEVQATLEYVFRKHGSARNGYASIVGSSGNATIMHYDKNDRRMAAGDLVLIDAACEYQHYSADITRTYPVNGSFSKVQRALYEVVLHALEHAIASVKPGITLNDLHNQTLQDLVSGMVELGILKGEVAKLIEDKAYMPFYGYFTCHWLGLDVHDKGPYKSRGLWDEDILLAPGMVFTIEPGLYIPAGTEGVDPIYWNIGIRIEDNVIVTAAGCENITADAPKSIADIEASMSR
ncbi:M24 family metallopeptidase [Ktedonosporobacter rubrisoli]|uniref:Xaa-Pro aminopeptidase n=1 Tax=Ktedonosporobacter rubrisoli TaxID=2509675 RepID=A0A4P6JHU3_KTERU|nr:aminopeptidase P N-terminal domain-containing protein [Ktedonosporobacter rubrisoli]QBD74597.1 M24 family metallopeptidase [Ktedonosporobacter rubrisoli]